MKDIFILCNRDKINEIKNLIDDVAVEFESGERVSILWSGETMRLGMGTMVIECEEEHIPQALMHELLTGKLISDYVIYDVPTYYLREDEK